MSNEYTPLITIGDEAQICASPEDERVLLLARHSERDLNRHDNGYAISRTALEHALGWETSIIHIYETDTGILREFAIEDYLNADEKPVFDEDYYTAPVQTA